MGAAVPMLTEEVSICVNCNEGELRVMNERMKEKECERDRGTERVREKERVRHR